MQPHHRFLEQQHLHLGPGHWQGGEAAEVACLISQGLQLAPLRARTHLRQLGWLCVAVGCGGAGAWQQDAGATRRSVGALLAADGSLQGVKACHLIADVGSSSWQRLARMVCVPAAVKRTGTPEP